MDSLPFLLKMKEKYETLEFHFQYLLNTYREIKDVLEEYHSSKDESLMEMKPIQVMIEFYQAQLDRSRFYVNDFQEKIQNNCEHTFIKDLIDLHPERSQEICYCTSCGYTCC